MPKKVYQQKRASVQPPIEQPHAFLFWVCVSTLVVVPLVFSTAVYRTYVLPKLAVLLVGATAILAMTVTSAVGRSPGNLAKAFKSRHVLLVSMYVTAMAVATVLGVAPLASLFGSSTVEMGLLTRLCFFVVFIGLIVAVGNSREPVIVLLWAMAGLDRLTARGRFQPPASSIRAMQQLEDLASPVAAFVRDRCTVGPNEPGVQKAMLYASYKAWCTVQGMAAPKANNVFARDLLSQILIQHLSLKVLQYCSCSALRRPAGKCQATYDLLVA